jgi:hypothetical protein
VTKSQKSWKLVVTISYESFQRPLVTGRRGMTSDAPQARSGRPACASLNPQLAGCHPLKPAAGYRDKQRGHSVVPVRYDFQDVIQLKPNNPEAL